MKRLAAVSLWCASFVAVAIAFIKGGIVADPYVHYFNAARHWWARTPLYELQHIDGFQYLPQTALVCTPFAYLPASSMVWRATGWLLYALGLWRLSTRLWPERADDCFLWASAVAIGPAVLSLANGQANLPLAALMMHATVELCDRRWNRATVWLMIGVALKPLMLVLLLVVWVLERRMWWRVPLALAFLAVVPFATAHHSYVMAQVRDCLLKLRACERPDRSFEDVRSMLWHFGWLIPHNAYLVVRAIAALATLAAAWRARRRFSEPWGWLLVLGFAGCYLMLFNPRTQANSYGMVASVLGLLAAVALLERRWNRAVLLCLIALAWCSNPRRGPKFPEHWLHPLGCIVFAGVLLSEKRPAGRPPRPPCESTPHRRDSDGRSA